MKYNKFDEIEHQPLRVYNRTVFLHNILEDNGVAPAERYISQFTVDEKLEMIEMTKLVRELGPKKVKEMVTEGLTFTIDEYISDESTVVEVE